MDKNKAKGARETMKTQFYAAIKNLLKAISLLLLILLVGSSQPGTLALGREPQTTAFVNVNVIPMDTERVLENQTVIVEGERITVIAPVNEVAVPEGAEIIKGNGAFLMPGLADMHTHLTFDADPNSMRLYLAQGVTTIRNLNAIPKHLAWREQVAKGELLGPTIYTSGPTIVGLPSDFKSMRYTFWAILILSPVVIGLIIWLIAWLVSRFTDLIADFRQIRRFILPSLTGLLLLGILLAWSKVIPCPSICQRSESRRG
jgi:hypothetical protein